MSASINWQPTGNHWSYAGGGSRIVECLRRAFGERCEWVLDTSSLAKLEGMFAATGEETYGALMGAINAHGSIRVKVSY